MLEVVGFIVWLVITVGLTALPFLIICLSALGGGIKRSDMGLIAVSFALAAFSWYHIFNRINITIN